ncbi:MAG: 50S ribosomal protein L18 [bacterium]|nr:50S ribosomal protein L18 [bacterium]
MKKKDFKIKLRKNRTRSKIFGTDRRPRLSVFRSLKFTYAQLIDDNQSKTMVSLSTRGITAKGKIEKARLLGEKIADAAKKAGIESAIFDRGHYQYHGRVKAVAEGARTGGLKF